jgi:hypothetical protein
MHVHLVMFQILDRIDIATGVSLPLSNTEQDSWKDTVMAMPGTRTRVIARFEDYVGKFAYHCHILEHEDHEMMRQFQVTYSASTCDGDGICEAQEDCESCASDCGIASGAECGNRLCEIGDGESHSTCPQDCAGDTGFSCGNPAEDPAFVDCSDDRCTSNGFFCRQKERVPTCCGDQVCQGAEDSQACGIDCGGSVCNNDGVCDPGEDCQTCSNDCDGRSSGGAKKRFCCGDGILQIAEGDGSICDGNP